MHINKGSNHKNKIHTKLWCSFVLPTSLQYSKSKMCKHPIGRLASDEIWLWKVCFIISRSILFTMPFDNYNHTYTFDFFKSFFLFVIFSPFCVLIFYLCVLGRLIIFYYYIEISCNIMFYILIYTYIYIYDLLDKSKNKKGYKLNGMEELNIGRD